jgi:DNA polymerase III subunit epsilon
MRGWLRQLLGRPATDLTPLQQERLAAWQALPAVDLGRSIQEARLVVVDVESTGLNVYKDDLIAIGAQLVAGERIQVGEAFDIVLHRAEHTDKENVLIHGISPTDLREGVPAVEALLAFLEFVGKSPLVAYHAAFDRTMLDRALRRHLGVRLPNAWIDLAWLAPALFPNTVGTYKSLDAWLEFFSLYVHIRHRAIADALATAELLLILVHHARGRGKVTFAGIADMARLEAEVAAAGRMGGV